MTLKYPLPKAKRIALVKLFYQSMYLLVIEDFHLLKSPFTAFLAFSFSSMRDSWHAGGYRFCLYGYTCNAYSIQEEAVNRGSKATLEARL